MPHSKIPFLRDLISGKLEVGEQKISPEALKHWLERKGYSEFGAPSWDALKLKYRQAGKPLDTIQDIGILLERMKTHKDGRLILSKAITEMFYGDISEDEKWELYQIGKKTGKCPLCGWKDGDGVKTCYYSKEVGAVTHENSQKGVLQQMTPSQRSLFNSYASGRLAYTSKEALQKAIQDKIQYLTSQLEHKKEELARNLKEFSEINSMQDIKQRGWGWKSIDHYREIQSDIIKKNRIYVPAYEKLREIQKSLKDAVIEFHITPKVPEGFRIERYIKTVEDSKKDGFLVSSTSPFEGAVRVQLPHSCGGFGTFFGPYHTGCTKCNEEVKLWEFGVDYDIG